MLPDPVLDLRQRPLCLLPTSQDAISHDALGQARRKHLKRPTCRRLRPLLRLGTLLLPHEACILALLPLQPLLISELRGKYVLVFQLLLLPVRLVLA